MVTGKKISISGSLATSQISALAVTIASQSILDKRTHLRRCSSFWRGGRRPHCQKPQSRADIQGGSEPPGVSKSLSSRILLRILEDKYSISNRRMTNFYAAAIRKALNSQNGWLLKCLLSAW